MLEQLHQQASSIRTLFKKRSQGPPSPTDHVLNQLVKGCQLMIQSTTSSAEERNKLRAANKKPKQKRIRYERQIPCNDDLSVPEAHELIDAPIEALIAPANPPPGPRRPSPPLQPRMRALPKCGLCGNQGHRRNACPNRPN